MKMAALLSVAAVGYLLGTESDRERRETPLVRLGRGSDGELHVDPAVDIIEDAPSA